MKGALALVMRAMRAQSSSFDVARMVRELRGWLEPAYAKPYQPHHEQVVLRLNPMEPSVDLRLCVERGCICLEEIGQCPQPALCHDIEETSRKFTLGQGRPTWLDRVVILTFEHGGGQYKLVIELFRDGNVLLLDDNDVILQPLTHAKYASRSLKRGEPYTPPRHWTLENLIGMA